CEVLELVEAGEVKREIAEINPYLLKTPRRHLPEKDQYFISVICPGASDRAWCDFLGGVDKKIDGKLHPDLISLAIDDISIHIKRVPTNMLSSADITASIRSSDGDIVVLTRGGGDEEEFGVFSDREVIRAWAEHTGYRISAIGHSDNITHVDIISDTYCRVPLDAGVEVVNLLGDIARQKRMKEQERLMGKLLAEKEALTKEKETLAKQIAELNVRSRRLAYLSLGTGLVALGLVIALVAMLFK
ncbi:MAG: exodeoxyribonuclease VII large subunit, partial [Candidatus Aenigmatarchaeota archaeon]